MVGSDSRMRVSSVMTICPSFSSVGTLKSTRTSTRFPETSRSLTESFKGWGPFLLAEDFEHLDAAVAVAPLVVVPADDFEELVAE